MKKFLGSDSNQYVLEYRKIKNTGSYAVCGIRIHESVTECSVRIKRSFKDSDGNKHGPVVRIEDGAFKGETKIVGIAISNGVRSIGKQAFSGCTSLEEINIPIHVTEIDDGAFENCVRLMKTPWGEGNISLDSIHDNVFRNCTGLETAYIPRNIKRIGDGAFAGCMNLKEVVFEKGVLKKDRRKTKKDGFALGSIGDSAFYGCRGLTDLESNFAFKLPDTVTKIGDRAFEGCTGLKAAPWDADDRKLKSIGNFAFRGAGLENAYIPEKVTEIGVGAFYGCHSLKWIRGMSGVRYIGRHAFCGCEKLLEADEPPDAVFISERAFEGCPNLARKPVARHGISISRSDYGPNDAGWAGLTGRWENKDIATIVGREAEKFMQIRGCDGNSRYRSYDHVHGAFLEYRTFCDNHPMPPEDDTRHDDVCALYDSVYDRLALKLYMYLSSWGMLRNSFLLYKDYRFLTEICKMICEDGDRFKRLVDVNPFSPEYNPEDHVFDLLELKGEMTEFFEANTYRKIDGEERPIDSVTDTLISKILLGALGCVPAFDRYVRAGMDNLLGLGQDENVFGGGVLRLIDLLRFVCYAEHGFVELTANLNVKYGDDIGERGYSVMKYVDMALWGYGYHIDGNDADDA